MSKRLHMLRNPEYECCLNCDHRRAYYAICDDECPKCHRPYEDHIWHDYCCGNHKWMSCARIAKEIRDEPKEATEK